MAQGYEDIERLTNRQNEMLDKSLQQQQDITNRQTNLSIQELQRNKDEIDRDVNKQNREAYAEYRKQSNPYGANAEQMYTRGLGNSGYAETTQTNLYNTYQRNITDTLNNARNLKSDFDFQMQKARETGNITLAQNSLDIFKQKMQLLTQEYEMRNNREQFLYQQEQDRLSQSNWEKEFAYQQQRDRVADSQWQQQYELSKKASASSSRRSSRSTSKSSGKSTSTVNTGGNEKQSQYTAKDIIGNAKILQRPGNQGAVQDGISGKVFNNMAELLKYYNV